MSASDDEINQVLRECEERLRSLATEGRLTADALSSFMKLACDVQQGMERRRTPDRREIPRGISDRRHEGPR